MAKPPQPFQCNPEHIADVISAAQLTNYFLPTPLTLFHFIDGSQKSCRLELNPLNSSIFNLFYSEKYNQTDIAVYKFTQNHNFADWNPVEPSHFYKFVKNSYFSLSNHVESRIWVNTISQFSSQEESQSTTIFTITKNSNKEVVNINGLCLHFSHILEALKRQIQYPNSYFAVLKEGTTETILTSDLGLLSSIGLNTAFLTPIFPNLAELNSTFWKVISKSLEGKNYSESVFIQTDEPKWIEFIGDDIDGNSDLYESRFIAIKNKLSSITDPHLYIVTVIKLDPKIKETFFLPAVISISMLVSIILVFIIVIAIQKYVIKRDTANVNQAMTTLTTESNTDSNAISYMNYNTGSLLRVISMIRGFQITIPDELSINPILDDCVSDLTLPEENLFSVEVKKHCELCSNLVRRFPKFDRNAQMYESSNTALINSIEVKSHQYQTTTSSSSSINIRHVKESIREENNIFTVFRKLTINQIKDGNILNWKLIDENPIKASVNQFLYIVNKFNLYNIEFDPDILTCFLLDFSSRYISFHIDNLATCYHLISLLNGPFDNWILDKIDIFIAFFTAFTMNFDYDKVLQTIENDENSDSLLQKKYLIFQDKYSTYHRKLEFILSTFHRYFPPYEYFDENFTDIFIGLQKTNSIQLFSDFQIRIQSPQFNVHDNVLDRRLFIKVLIHFCSQWPYFSDEKLMIRGIQSLNEQFNNITGDDRNDYIKEYHLTYAHCFVRPWIDLLSQFSPLKKINENYQNTIEYLNMEVSIADE